HSADRARAGFTPNDLRVHRTGVFDFLVRCRAISAYLRSPTGVLLGSGLELIGTTGTTEEVDSTTIIHCSSRGFRRHVHAAHWVLHLGIGLERWPPNPRLVAGT